jgi:hypothetical protein
LGPGPPASPWIALGWVPWAGQALRTHWLSFRRQRTAAEVEMLGWLASCRGSLFSCISSQHHKSPGGTISSTVGASDSYPCR